MQTTKLKFWGAMVGAFFLGAVMVSGGQQPSVAGEAQQVVKEVQVENREAFDRLNALDQQIFALSAEVIDAQTEALTLAGNILGNLESVTVDEMDAATSRVNELTEQITRATQEVQSLQAERATLVAN